MRQRSACGALAIALLLPQVSLSAGVSVWGAGNESCGRWAAVRNSDAHEAMKHWILGFLSGSNWRAQNQQAIPPDADAVFAFVDKYCRNNPLHSLVLAGAALIEESGGPKAAHRWDR